MTTVMTVITVKNTKMMLKMMRKMDMRRESIRMATTIMKMKTAMVAVQSVAVVQ